MRSTHRPAISEEHAITSHADQQLSSHIARIRECAISAPLRSLSSSLLVTFTYSRPPQRDVSARRITSQSSAAPRLSRANWLQLTGDPVCSSVNS